MSSSARICRCHERVSKAVASGASFQDAYAKHARPGYHEHRCECSCGCKHDTQGYALCAPCGFGNCARPRGAKRFRWEAASGE